jgi:hypothetical protein
MATDAQIRALCEARGLTFRPWGIAPWDVHPGEACPWPQGSGGSDSWPKAQALRARLAAEIEAAG